MARSRNIKPGFFKNEDLADLGPYVQLLFAGLWTLADREGILEDRPRRIKADIFPHYDFDVNGGLTLLHRFGFVRRYKVNDKPYIHIVEFAKHQSPHSTERKSDLPGPDHADPDEVAATPHESTVSTDNVGLTVSTPLGHHGNTPDSLNTDSLIPDSLCTDSPNPDSPTSSPALPLVERRKIPRAKTETPTTETWAVYTEAFRNRYKIEPVRNATTNGQMAQFVKRIGEEEAPSVAAFYVRHNDSYFVREMHGTGPLLAKAEALRAQWASGQRVTSTSAYQMDKTQTNGDVFAGLIAEAREAKNGNQSE